MHGPGSSLVIPLVIPPAVTPRVRNALNRPAGRHEQPERVWLVRAGRLDRCYAELRKTGNARNGGGALSESRVRDIHAIMSGALGLAARYGWIDLDLEAAEVRVTGNVVHARGREGG
jgi:hypothetical protein